VRRTRVRALLTALIITAVMGTIIFVLWIGARQVQAGTLSMGELGAFLIYAALVAGGVGTLAEVWGDVMRASGATGRLLELLHAEPAIRDPQTTAPDASAGAADIELERVVFCYPARPGVRALDDISLHIAPGEKVALVGPSGAGKTTLFQLLLRYYEVSDGCIRIGGRDIRALPLRALRAGIAIVPQDPVIFSASALDNIRYGRPEASDDEVIAAARAAAAARRRDAACAAGDPRAARHAHLPDRSRCRRRDRRIASDEDPGRRHVFRYRASFQSRLRGSRAGEPRYRSVAAGRRSRDRAADSIRIAAGAARRSRDQSGAAARVLFPETQGRRTANRHHASDRHRQGWLVDAGRHDESDDQGEEPDVVSAGVGAQGAS